MSIIIFDQASLNSWIDRLIEKQDVIGVQAKGDLFHFAPLLQALDLRLDYDVTILPPKKYFLPQRENLLEFTHSGQYQEVLPGKPFILFGVHPYDVAAISQMDKIFSAENYDVQYMNRRQNATIIACDVQTPSRNVFAGYMGTATVETGFDILLTKIGNTYVVEPKTKKGEALVSDLSHPPEATADDLKKREEIWRQNKQRLRKHQLKAQLDEIPDLLAQSYYDPIWDEKSELCFSCGSCNLVCPTCYCFDVQDHVNWDLQTGIRTRAWDGCLMKDFAAVAGGHNFRRQRADRYRHRYYRKGKYIPDKFGQLACVGCGRCITACIPNIANPVEVYNRIYVGHKNIYIPEPATLIKTTKMTEDETFYEVCLDSQHDLNHAPGQFVELSVAGIGEAPISISSSPTQTGIFQMVVRKVGNVTTALSKLGAGDKIGIRGPFGSQFPVSDIMLGRDLLFICGGIGLVPVRSAIKYVLDNRDDYGKITILYGVKTPADRLFRDELPQWAQESGVTVLETVDNGDQNWQGNVGVITSLLPQISVEPAQTIAIVCGPPAMYKFVLQGLTTMGMSDEHIYLSLERRMKCGVGKCGHCQMNHIYVCQEGPVFRYSDIKDVMEAIQ